MIDLFKFFTYGVGAGDGLGVGLGLGLYVGLYVGFCDGEGVGLL
jgi:hypothetical protein